MMMMMAAAVAVVVAAVVEFLASMLISGPLGSPGMVVAVTLLQMCFVSCIGSIVSRLG